MILAIDIQALLDHHQMKVKKRRKTSGELRAESLRKEDERLTGR
ncbi:hypothetical protein HNO89_000691 [Sporosarcina luteola]|nr:hypothetical protein [Sporosarcina luteola]